MGLRFPVKNLNLRKKRGTVFLDPTTNCLFLQQNQHFKTQETFNFWHFWPKTQEKIKNGQKLKNYHWWSQKSDFKIFFKKKVQKIFSKIFRQKKFQKKLFSKKFFVQFWSFRQIFEKKIKKKNFKKLSKKFF